MADQELITTTESNPTESTTVIELSTATTTKQFLTFNIPEWFQSPNITFA
jgi:hypothetical protein